MNHAVWKLAALGLVVAVGAFIVIKAQRGMQGDPSSDDVETAAASTDEGYPGFGVKEDDLDAPEQSEPAIASEEMDPEEIAGAAKPRAGSERSSGYSRSSVGFPDEAKGDGGDSPSESRIGKLDADPFDALDDSEQVATDNEKAAAARTAAAPKKPSVDVLEIDDDGPPDVDVNEATSTKPSAKSRPAVRRSAGPVLTLEDSDDEAKPATKGRPLEASRGPGRLRDSETESARPIAAEEASDDPFSDDGRDHSLENPPHAAGSVADAKIDDEDDEIEAPRAAPRALTQPAKSKPARGLNVDDAELEADELPAVTVPRKPAKNGPGLPTPDGSIETDDDSPTLKLSSSKKGSPAELSRSIEVDDAPQASPPPARLGLRARGDEKESPRAFPSLPDDSEDPEALPQRADARDDPPTREPAAAPELTIEKIAPPQALLGRPMVYEIVVRNVGAIPAYQVVVEDTIPRNARLDGTIPQAQLKENKLIWKLGNLPAGAEKKIAVRIIPQAEGTLGSVATVNFSAEPRPAAQAAAPQLKFDVLAPRQAIVGTPVEFKFRVKNLGRVPASGVVIRDVLPAALRHPDGDDLEFEIGQLPAGKEREVPLTLTAAQAGPAVNRVVVTADGNVAEEAEVQLEVVGPALKVTRLGPKRLFPEKTGVYTNEVANPGRSLLAEVTIVEAVPAGMEFVDASGGGTYNAAKRTISWTIRNLGPDESQSVKVKLRSSGRGTQISVVRASDPSGASGETVGATHVSGVPALSIEIGEIPALIETGETVTLGVRIINRGSDVAGSVLTTVTIPAGMQLVSATGPVDHRETNDGAGEGRGIVVTFSSIARIDPRADAGFELTLRARVPGETRLKIEARCDQMAESVRREEIATIVAAE
jgi:uncharacterized repeat protein (TIGR01451 family)